MLKSLLQVGSQNLEKKEILALVYLIWENRSKIEIKEDFKNIIGKKIYN